MSTVLAAARTQDRFNRRCNRRYHSTCSAIGISSRSKVTPMLQTWVVMAWVCAEEFLRVDALEMGILALVTEFA